MGDFPFWVVWILLYFGATLRGQATYWLGRGARSGALHRTGGPGWWRRIRERAVAMDAGAGRRVLDRIGVPAVPLAYLTVGLQSAIIIAAGLVRMRWRTFSLAQIPGAAAWATIYSTIGFAAWAAAIRAIAGDWWPLAIGVLLIALAALIITLCRRARRRPAEAGDETYSLGADPLAGARR